MNSNLFDELHRNLRQSLAQLEADACDYLANKNAAIKRFECIPDEIVTPEGWFWTEVKAYDEQNKLIDAVAFAVSTKPQVKKTEGLTSLRQFSSDPTHPKHPDALTSQ